MIVGNKKDTVVLGGHTDVVSASVYGESEKYAFDISKIKEHLDVESMSEIQREDYYSEKWIWGRGVADMKGGIALNLRLMEEYGISALDGKLDGSVLFIAVPDEESYSAGMRVASKLMAELKKKYKLKYKLLINPEPAAELGDAQVMSLGTVGKCLPVVMVQGQLAHIGHGYNGISALNMATNIYQKTNGSLQFSDQYEGEATMPPIWANLRDMKVQYDASLPERAYGFLTVLSFSTTVMEIVERLKKIAVTAFEEETSKQNMEYQQFKKINKFATKECLEYKLQVYTLEEFQKKLEDERGDSYKQFFDELYEKTCKSIESGVSYPVATVEMMEKLLDFSEIKTPVILIGLAPPYYPSTHSDMVNGFSDVGTQIYNHIKELSMEVFGQRLVFENYFMGISDNSYTSVSNMDLDSVKNNFLLWGKSYSLDFDSLYEVAMPSILYGPIGREYHQWTERVNRQSLTEVMPKMLKEVVAFAWQM